MLDFSLYGLCLDIHFLSLCNYWLYFTGHLNGIVELCVCWR